MARFDVLAQLERFPDGLTMSDLSRRLIVSNGAITGMVDKLMQGGLVVRAYDPARRRSVIVRLTRKGRESFLRMARRHEEWVVSIVGELYRRGAVGAAAEPDAAPSQPRPACEELTMDAAMTTREPLDAGRFFAPGDRSLAVMLQAQAKKYGAKPLVQAGEQSWSFAEVPELAARSAGRLQAAGVAPGDRVALICANRPEFMHVFLARLDRRDLVPINTASRGHQLSTFWRIPAARLMILEGGLLAPRTLDLATPAARNDLGSSMPRREGAADRIVSVPALGDPFAAAPRAEATPLAILYTSGTTGPSKGVCCPHAQFFWWGVNTRRCSASAPTTCSARPCRCSTPTRSTPSSRR